MVTLTAILLSTIYLISELGTDWYEIRTYKSDRKKIDMVNRLVYWGVTSWLLAQHLDGTLWFRALAVFCIQAAWFNVWFNPLIATIALKEGWFYLSDSGIDGWIKENVGAKHYWFASVILFIGIIFAALLVL